MNLLYALIAFSVIMIVISTVVVALVNFIYEVRGMRKRHLRYFLGAVFDEYLWPEFGRTVVNIEQRTIRSEQKVSAALPELKPRHGFWANCVAALDLWTLVHDAWIKALVENPVDRRAREVERPWYFAFLSVGLWVVIVFFVAICLSHDLLVPIALFGVFLFFAIDRVRESDRERVALWHGTNSASSALLADLDKLLHLETKLGEEGSLNAAERTRLNDLRANERLRDPGLRDLHARLTRRRVFIDEILKSSKSIAANAGRAEKSNQSNISVIDFAAHLGRTEFGEAIRRTAQNQKENALEEAADMLNKMIDEMARRFDGLGNQATENFREIARRWSMVMAFVAALIVNVDAIRLFHTFYEDSELSQRVTAAYESRVEAMSKRELELIQEIATKQAADGSTSTANAEKDMQALRGEMEQLQGAIAETAEELSALGLPIGWDFFPFCRDISELRKVTLLTEVEGQRASVGFDHTFKDAQCRDLAVWYVENHGERLGLSDGDNEKSLKNGLPLTFEAIRSEYEEGDPRNYFYAAWNWIGPRWLFGMSSWIFGVLLAGVLIGLGGPFWFDLYKRLSAVAQIARAGGLVGKPVKADDANQSVPAEKAHAPIDVRDAFLVALEVQQQLNAATGQDAAFEALVALAENADESRETPVGIKRPLLPLRPDGSSA